nr:hypothetical protein [Tanacetum cinerariifolium]
KTILNSYGETAILKRRREDDDDQEGPSAGSDRGSKRRREGGEPKSARAPLEPATRSAGRSTTRSKSQQASASESAFTEEPVQTISQIEEPSHSVFETGKRKARKGQNRIKTGQKGKAWRSQEKSKAVTVDKGRKTEENIKKGPEMQTHTSYIRRKKVQGLVLQLNKSSKQGANLPMSISCIA